jgi:general secretion pathway protein G
MRLFGRGRSGFTLIELMIIVAIIGVLAAIALPKFGDLVRKATEGSTRGSLASVRSAINVYYSDMEGVYPGSLLSITQNGKYLPIAPESRMPKYHDGSKVEYDGLLPLVDDLGGWWYDNATSDANFGTAMVNCTHTDSKGSVWTTY